MSNETPQSEGEPTPSASETPASEPPPPAAAASQEPPTVENKPFTYDDAVKTQGDEDDVADVPPTVAAPAGAPPAAPVAVAADRPAGIFVPKWVGIVVAAVIAALVFGGIGYAVGDSSSGDSHSENASSNVPGSGDGNGNRQFPNGQVPNGQLPNGGQRQLPGNGNGNGGGTGQTTGNGGFLGVAVGTATNGVAVNDVQTGSGAADAGLKAGDVITAVDGTNVSTPQALVSAIQQHKAGDQVTITYTRGGQSATAKVTLGSQTSTQSN